MNRAPIDAQRLHSSSADGPLSFYDRIEVVESTGSTNADLVARAADTAVDRQVLLAEEQVHGRGRHARSWVSPPRAQISLSILVRLPDIDPTTLGWLPLLTGVAVVDALRATPGVSADLKWPNDVLLGGRKLAGILAEVAATGAAPAVVVGIGVNVDLDQSELPVPHATSLTLAGADTDRTALVAAILTEFAARFTAWQRAGWATTELAAAYRERCATIGIEVRAELPGGQVVTGVATDVDDTGRLLIGDRAVSAGDVSHLRGQY
ncbi:putative biotin--acetyl-CoA-carboxylase ligase (BirA bifunctional protein) [Nocardia neocaledoniensis NBRC 108232]|uniref:biotin--[biotin carboxyl-carrier protein] ligase n=1 Tax=Nocardia neocaledoniensis TaxID=236511 RepID=A0A317NQA2_9NOCA|nr:biotin--[acetyl-CoA-carboxylase] ligase [Nocardia neocaledoniensis]PWV77479.1 BirA family biotin operon repressor/biotin-[acetyl-CoA-carboxylase] ligase [Nocardia neocaledoniensis]GEM34678.1 putative biotin--acetyl-CoA-carboxylase ligase (BirA bifunctional protein) [Nocardia neocaledoniensis NBRC 108232]